MKKGIVIATLVWTIIGVIFTMSAPDSTMVFVLAYGALVIATCIFYLKDIQI